MSFAKSQWLGRMRFGLKRIIPESVFDVPGQVCGVLDALIVSLTQKSSGHTFLKLKKCLIFKA
jgi:hypothetical protein